MIVSIAVSNKQHLERISRNAIVINHNLRSLTVWRRAGNSTLNSPFFYLTQTQRELFSLTNGSSKTYRLPKSLWMLMRGCRLSLHSLYPTLTVTILKHKIVTLTLLWASLLFCAYILTPIWLKCLMMCIAVGVTWHILSYKSE